MCVFFMIKISIKKMEIDILNSFFTEIFVSPCVYILKISNMFPIIYIITVYDATTRRLDMEQENLELFHTKQHVRSYTRSSSVSASMYFNLPQCNCAPCFVDLSAL